MDETRRDEVRQIAISAGVPAEEFDGWDGKRLALYTDTGGHSASSTIANEIMAEKRKIGASCLDLGHRSTLLSPSLGLNLRAAFEVRTSHTRRRATCPIAADSPLPHQFVFQALWSWN